MPTIKDYVSATVKSTILLCCEIVDFFQQNTNGLISDYYLLNEPDHGLRLLTSYQTTSSIHHDLNDLIVNTYLQRS